MSLSQSTKSPKRDFDSTFGVDPSPQASLPTPPISIKAVPRDNSPARSHTGSMTDPESTTPSRKHEPSQLPSEPVSAFAALNGTPQPPAKKPKLTFAEKEEQKLNKQIRDAEKAAERAKKEADKREKAEEKAKREAENEAQRLKREAEREEKRRTTEANKAAKEEAKRQANEAKRQKDEEKMRREEEKKKKERSQPKLMNFFGAPTIRRGSVSSRESMSPAPGASASDQQAPSKAKEISFYEKQFPPFFVHSDVKVAPYNRFERDQQGSESIEKTLDSYVVDHRGTEEVRRFDAVSYFHMLDTTLRGKRSLPVREIMTAMSGNASKPIDLTTDSQNSQIKRTGVLLSKIPVKFLKFQEDVRPPYIGTYTSRPVTSISKLARNFKRRDLPNTNYDYDSEAEWVEDEDAEDCNSDGEEEEDLDDVDDMDGFLDDDNDDGLNSRRIVVQGDLEPVSTGLCWEDHRKCNTNVKMVQYRMEIMLDGPIKSIDPFSKAYWESPVTTSGSMDPPRLPLHAVKGNNLFSTLSSKPVKPAFSSPQPQSTPLASATAKPHKKMITDDAMEGFKREVAGSDLSKIGLVEVLKKKFPKQTGAAIKETLETIAKRVGTKQAEKRWVIIDEHQ
ncbi:hypothetical protein BP6252_02129 [Coleophoma cylindrospora]|uniref:Chromatin assembly factor 1 subunit A n=1 Tax=Coleophoma cylindrospora TaxID=1849047 RepID=A0A3D8SDZ5_9HELO|nr:hypothetical protein BP6252_02129 [Coleophoma cylindrospora]